MSEFGSLGGALARHTVRALVRIFYPRIEVTGREFIPADGPVLFVANHPNALMDPVMVGIAARRPVHFLAKAPLFQVPVFGRILDALGMLPAYRAVDDPNQVSRNIESLANAAKCLLRGEAVGIFPEGKSHDKLQVDQVKTGAARIAQQAFAEGAKRLLIVPVGLNYEEKDRVFSSVWVRVGEPIRPEYFLQQSDADERKSVRALTAEIDRVLKRVVIHLNETQWERFLPDLEVLQPASTKPSRDAVVVLGQRKNIADAMNYFFDTDRARAEAVGERIERHRENLEALGLGVRSPVIRMRGALLLGQLKWQLLLLVGGFVPALAGTLHHVVPFLLTRGIAHLFQTPGRSSIALARLLVGLPLYAGWYALVGWWLATRVSALTAVLWLAAMPICGAIALCYWPRARVYWRHWFQQVQMWFRPEQLRRFREEQLQIRREMRLLAEQYEQDRLRRRP